MTMLKNREAVEMSGIFGVVIGMLFLAFGGMGNFLCEMLFWSFVLYLGMVLFDFAPKVVKDMMKKHAFLSQCLMSLAWVPIVVGGMIVIFLGSLLFVDYSSEELSQMLVYSKTILFGIMILSLGAVSVRKFDCFQFAIF